MCHNRIKSVIGKWAIVNIDLIIVEKMHEKLLRAFIKRRKRTLPTYATYAHMMQIQRKPV